MTISMLLLLVIPVVSTGHYCLHRFNHLLPFSSHSELTKLAEEFVDYQLLRRGRHTSGSLG